MEQKVASFQTRSFDYTMGVERRKRGRFSQEQAARACGVSLSTIQRALDEDRTKPMNMAWTANSPSLGARFERHYCRAFCDWDAKGRP